MLLVLSVLGLHACGRPQPGAEGATLPARELHIAVVDGALPVEDPAAAAWDHAREVVVPLLPQDVVEPRLTKEGTQTLALRALHDGRRVAFRLAWGDERPDALVDDVRSSDAVAIQLPATGADGPVPSAMMGEEGQPVAISLWRFAWQERLAGKPHGVAALYPYASVDHYPPDGAKGEETRAELQVLFDPPRAARNPLSQPLRSPVEDLHAEGFGSLTHAEIQHSTGRGVHAAGGWTVVITRPLDLGPHARTALAPGSSTQIAVAVWDGAANHTGPKKMRSNWVPVEIEEAAP